MHTELKFYNFIFLGNSSLPVLILSFPGHPWDDLIPILLDVVAKYRMKLSFHMEPYKHRNGESLLTDIKYIIDNYGNHSGLYKMKRPKSRRSK